jgi:hypothetical protein
MYEYSLRSYLALKRRVYAADSLQCTVERILSHSLRSYATSPLPIPYRADRSFCGDGPTDVVLFCLPYLWKSTGHLSRGNWLISLELVFDSSHVRRT